MQSREKERDGGGMSSSSIFSGVPCGRFPRNYFVAYNTIESIAMAAIAHTKLWVIALKCEKEINGE